MPKKRVIVALSGGVDSAMAATLLQTAGYEVIETTASMWTENENNSNGHKHRFDNNRNIKDIELICNNLGISFHIIDVKREFKEHVIDYLRQEYFQGRTPNPCIAYNHYIKFSLILEHSLTMDADYMATDHYAKIKHYDNTCHLIKGTDTNKDQSYMLYTLTQEELAGYSFHSTITRKSRYEI